MTQLPWALQTMVVIDVETTGVDVETDRIVSAAVTLIRPRSEPLIRRFLLAVDVDIPAEATAIHGITTEHARTAGMPPAHAIDIIAGCLCIEHHRGAPIITMNTPFDLTILDRELRRHRLPLMEDRLGRPVGPVIDVFVVDKFVDRYRKGKRTLTALAEHYGARQGAAHNADEDTLTTARVAYQIARRAALPEGELRRLYADRDQPGEVVGALKHFHRLTPAQLHDLQVVWYRQQSQGLGAHWKRKAKELRDLAALADIAAHTAQEDTLAAKGTGDPAAAEHEQVAKDHAEKAANLRAEAENLLQRADLITTEWPVRTYLPPITGNRYEQETLL